MSVVLPHELSALTKTIASAANYGGASSAIAKATELVEAGIQATKDLHGSSSLRFYSQSIGNHASLAGAQLTWLDLSVLPPAARQAIEGAKTTLASMPHAVNDVAELQGVRQTFAGVLEQLHIANKATASAAGDIAQSLLAAR